MTSAPAIGFEVRPSHWLGRLLFSVSLLAMVAIWLCALAWMAKIALSAAVGFACWRAQAGPFKAQVKAAGWSRDGGWTLRMSEGEDMAATLASFRVVGEVAVWLRLALPGRHHVVLLLAPDNSDADIRRRLRMRLAQVEASGTKPA